MSPSDDWANQQMRRAQALTLLNRELRETIDQYREREAMHLHRIRKMEQLLDDIYASWGVFVDTEHDDMLEDSIEASHEYLKALRKEKP